MKIRWPRLTFPPINLWTAPHQPALEDTMTATAERDAVQDQLCARIDELERDKEVLAAQVDRLEEQLAMLRSQADALHRIGYVLDLDPGTDLAREAPARVVTLRGDRDQAIAMGKVTFEQLRRVEAEMGRLRSFRSAVCGWRESDWPEGFCRRTAELVADHGRQAEGGE